MRKILNWFVTKLIKIENVKDFIAFRSDKVFVGKEEYKLSDIKGMVKDIEVIRQIPTWDIVRRTIVNNAQDTIFNKSTDFNQVVNAKMVLWTLNEIDVYFNTIIAAQDKAKALEEQKKANKSFIQTLERKNL